MKAPKFFLAALVVDISLIAVYMVLNYCELSRLLILSVTDAVDWNPIANSVFFQFGILAASSVIKVGWFNWSFLAELAIIMVNLLVIWMMEQKFFLERQS